MTDYVISDPSIPLPAAHPLEGVLPLDLAPVQCDAITGSAPISLVGNSVAATGTAGEGFDTVMINGVEVLQHLRMISVDGWTARQTSLGVVRTVDGGSDGAASAVACTERAVVLPDLPAISIAWTAADGSFSVQWECAGTPANGTLRYHCGPSSVAVDGRAVFAFTHDVAAWDITDISTDMNPRIRVRADIATGDRDTALHIVARSPSHPDPQRTLDQLRNVVPLTRAFAGTQRRRQREHLVLRSPDPYMDQALQWAVQSVAFVPHTDPVDLALHAIAAIAVGDSDTARGLLSHAGIEAAGPMFLIVVARYHAATADTSTIIANWAAVERVAAAALADPAVVDEHGDARTALVIMALSAVAATAGDIGRTPFNADLASRVKQLSIRHADALRRHHWLDAVDHDAVRGWRSSSYRADVSLDSPVYTILPIALGVCGIEPEAARNRLRIRTRFPDAWQFVEIANVRVGDARVRLLYGRDGDSHTFEAQQVSGGVPTRLILEPVLSGAGVESTSVDGDRADLTAVELDGRIMVPVQLVLDETRRLEVRMRKPPPDHGSGGGS